MQKFRHLDLFSGIGGFALASGEVWPDREIVAFCDNDHFCQQVLTKNFPGTRIYGDIRELTADGLVADTRSEKPHRVSSERREEVAASWKRYPKVDLLTGGFPCQPFSHAGKRRGTKDDRHLWPEMLRVISETLPRWVIGENVRGLLSQEGGMVFETVCTDMEGLGYKVWPFVLPACAVGAPHRRERVWIVGKRMSIDPQCGRCQEGGEREGVARLQKRRQDDAGSAEESSRCDTADTEGRWERPVREENTGRKSETPSRNGNRLCPNWNRDWREVASSTCHDRVDDGLPKRMARLPDGSTISEAALRRESLKGYGNAIVPQVAVEIMKAIRSVESLPTL